MAYVQDPVNQIYCIGSVVGPHPFPMMVRDFQQVVGLEAREQIVEMTGDLPDIVTACVGGGSNAMGIFAGFIDDPVALHGVEPLGKGPVLGEHSASMTYGKEGIIHGFRCYLLQDGQGEPAPVHSIASGLDYPGVGPEHCHLKDSGRVSYFTAMDTDAVEAFYVLSRNEGIIPALESAHAVAHAMRLARENPDLAQTVLVNLSGRGDKDMDYMIEHYGEGAGFEI
jgi:tryptophan synthase beta subunit